MDDRISKEKRSWNMSRIKGKENALEIKVRKYLWHHGYRYRKNYSKLPGKPDIVLTKHMIVIFVNGCFWHHHDCQLGSMPKSNVEFWQSKFQRNRENDLKNIIELEQLGYAVITVWECELQKDFEKRMAFLI
ncbi:MAG TPA: very short patch repair endonuclease, partial [Erysipelotrichaceae bacterium]|nr:very short patch repair endonuclease [Erysipelotrichaceae bacterium]